MSQHTPTLSMKETMLYGKTTYVITCHFDQQDRLGAVIATLQDKKAAAFIVKAVNNFDRLLKVCEMIYAVENEKDDFCPGWMTALRQAIAKAEA